MPEVIAHRGASAYAPEHTFAAYDLALALGADRLELDVRVTADGTPVVLHDATLRRTHADPRRVDEVCAADVDLLTLDAVLDRYDAPLLVELKDPAPTWERRVADAVAGRAAVVQSFDHAALRRLADTVPVSALVRFPGEIPDFVDSVGVWHPAVDAALVARGLHVRAWTANDPAEIARLLALGVDVITDRPDVASQQLADQLSGALRAA